MSFMGWSSASLYGRIHSIPRLCPNCLAEGTEELRYRYENWLHTFFVPCSGAIQSFFYCPACAPQARAAVFNDRVRRGMCWMLSLLVISLLSSFLLAPFIGPWGLFREPWMKLMEETKGMIGLIVWAVWTLIVVCGILLALRIWARRRHPQTGAQAVWGLAAYYVGHGDYYAVRKEWLQELVALNRDWVTDKEYERVTRTSSARDRQGSAPIPFSG